MDDKKPDLSPLVMRGRTMVSQGRTDDAIGIYSDVIKIDPNHAMAHADRGTAYAMTSKLDLARADLEKSFALGYKEPSAFSTAGTVCLQLKDYTSFGSKGGSRAGPGKRGGRRVGSGDGFDLSGG